MIGNLDGWGQARYAAVVAKALQDDVVDVFAMVRLGNRLRDSFAARMKHEKWAHDAGFRPPCAGTLVVISRDQPVSQRDVSRVLGIDPADLVGVIDILEQAGLVTRERDQNDRRRYALSLTKAGEARLARIDALRREAVDEVLVVLTPTERSTLARLVGKAVTPYI
jgi:DNA-binding MarR family transcriptional regulator